MLDSEERIFAFCSQIASLTRVWVLCESGAFPLVGLMEKHRRDESPSGLSDIIEQDGLLGTGLTVSQLSCFLPLRVHDRQMLIVL